MDNIFLKQLDAGKVLLADGATGTNLFAAGLSSGDAPELWNIDAPEKIEALHQSFVDAGADIILSNSFGGNRKRLELHQAQDRVEELNVAAAQLAKKTAQTVGKPIIIAGSMGPTGEMLMPLGLLTPEEATEIFAEQAQALKKGGADVIWIETMSSLEELQAAVDGAKQAGLPIVTTMSFDTHGHTMMGIAPKAFSDYKNDILKDDVTAIGCNCGVGAEETLDALKQMDANIIKVAKANCGIPQYVDGAIHYSGTPQSMAEYTKSAIEAGVKIIGGCCGTTPAHLKAMRQAIDENMS